MIDISLGMVGVIVIDVQGKNCNRVAREFAQREDYYGCFYGPQTEKWYCSYHTFDRVMEYLKRLQDPDSTISRELKEIMALYKGQQRTVEKIKSGEPCPELNLQNLKKELYPVQVIGARWLRLVERGLLADEMGLGKTPMSISAAIQLINEAGVNRILVVCPKTPTYQWADEIFKFAPAGYDDRHVVEGSARSRPVQYGAHLWTIANYEIIRSDIDIVKQVPWDIVITDEAQRYKTRGSFKTDKKTGQRIIVGNQTTACIKELKARYRWALSGTPIENGIVDMFSILEFIDPMVLGSIASFKRKFSSESPWGRQSGTRNPGELSKRLAPIVLRREKKDYLHELPPVTANREWSSMLDKQQTLYKAVEQESLKELNELGVKSGKDLAQGKFAIITKLIYLRQIVNSAELYEPNIKDSGKTHTLLGLIEDNPGKFLIFSQFKRMVNILAREIRGHFKDAVDVLVIDGDTPSLKRNDIKDEFNESKRQTVLVATDAAKEALNLQAARWVVNFDLPYNPATVGQRVGRAHRAGGESVERLGMDRNINVIDILVRNTVEDRVLTILQHKTAIFKGIMNDEQILHKCSLDDLRYILTGNEKYNRQVSPSLSTTAKSTG